MMIDKLISTYLFVNEVLFFQKLEGKVVQHEGRKMENEHTSISFINFMASMMQMT